MLVPRGTTVAGGDPLFHLSSERSWPFQQNVPKRTFELEVRRRGFEPYKKRLVIDGRRKNMTVKLKKKGS